MTHGSYKMTFSFRRLLLLLKLSAALLPTATAFSTGAGSCTGGLAPVGGKHLELAVVTSGSLEAYNISVTVGSSGALVKGVPHSFEYGRPHFLTISSPNSTAYPFRGFLIRLESADATVDTTTALRVFGSDEDTRVATETCVDIEGVGGLTHTNNTVKGTTLGVLELNAAASNLLLDVTVVARNGGFFSTFYHTQFVLNAVASDASPTATAQGGGEISPSALTDFSPVSAPTLMVDDAPVANVAGQLPPASEPVFAPSTRAPMSGGGKCAPISTITVALLSFTCYRFM